MGHLLKFQERFIKERMLTFCIIGTIFATANNILQLELWSDFMRKIGTRYPVKHTKQETRFRRIENTSSIISDALRSNQKWQDSDYLPMGNPCNEYKILVTFSPFFTMLTEIERTSDVNVIENGTPVIYVHEQKCWFPLSSSINVVCDIFLKLINRFNWIGETQGMRKLAAKIEVGMPLFQSDIDAARSSLLWMCDVIRQVSPIQYSEASVDIQIREALKSTSVSRRLNISQAVN